ncbi:MAG: nitroreductase family protein [Pseudomonadota bacterium]
MPERNQAALDFLLARRSRPAKTLGDKAPSEAELSQLLTAAARTPDHGKLEPFRFIIIESGAQERLAGEIRERMTADGEEEEKIEKQSRAMTYGGMIVAVVCRPVDSPKIPDWEQHLSAGGACLALLNAALASGWGANWLTGWASYSRWFMETHLGLEDTEFVVGFIHIGDEQFAPPDRPRPNIAAITSRISA